MLIAVDIGNTQIKLGLFDNEHLVLVSYIKTALAHDFNEIFSAIRENLSEYNKSSITDAIVSSVVPIAGANVTSAIEQLYEITPLMVSSELDLGMNIKIDNPKELGADLISSSVATAYLYNLPAIVFDFGTATKVTVIDKNKNFLGCCILAGIGISMEALSEKTALLHTISIEAPKSVIGTNTTSSINSGLIFGAASIIDGMSELIQKELNINASLILTGGYSDYIYGHTNHNVIFSKNLILEGLRIIYERNI